MPGVRGKCQKCQGQGGSARSARGEGKVPEVPGVRGKCQKCRGDGSDEVDQGKVSTVRLGMLESS